MSLAVFEQISLGFGKKTIVEGLDLRVAADDRIGLIGPNGSGKTSILRMLAEEQAPDAGRMRLRRGLRLHVDAVHRLVEENDAAFLGERAGKEHSLLLAERHFADRRVRPPGQADAV